MGWKDIEEKVLGGLTGDQQIWVQNSVNLDANNDLWEMPKDRLIGIFPEPGGEPGIDINDAALMKTFVWQTWLRIQTKECEPVDGNQRSFWYRDVEPFYIEKELMEAYKVRGKASSVRSERLFNIFSMIDWDDVSRIMRESGIALPLISKDILEGLNMDVPTFERVWRGANETYITNLISRTLDDFVIQGIFRFHYNEEVPGDFKFRDPREDFRIIGRNRGRLMFYTEKEGLWWLCEYAAKKHGISAVASKGEPGLLATEYLYDALVAAKVRSLDIGAITDYDPWGAKIPVNQRNKLQENIFFGPSPGKVNLAALNEKEKDLEKFFTPGEIDRYKRDLRLYSQYKYGQVEEWVAGGGGIKGEWYGIHIDTANRQRLRDEVDRWVKSVL